MKHWLALLFATSARQPADTVRLDLVGQFDAPTLPSLRGGGEIFESSFHPRGGAANAFVSGLARYGAGRPAVGHYPLAPLDKASPGGRFYATYLVYPKTRDDTTRGYVSLRGELTVTESTDERVAGTLRFTGGEYTASWPPAGGRGSGTPAVVAPDAPTVEVVATFVATRRRPELEVVCVGTGGPSVVVEVRDQDGNPAAHGASLVIEDGAFRDSAGPTSSWDGLHLGAGDRRPGRYTVRVTKPYHAPVVISRVVAAPTGNPRCGYAEPKAATAVVTLRMLPNAPPVRQVLVLPTAMGLWGIPGTEHHVTARVEAARGQSRAVQWTSSDTTLLVVRLESDSTAVVVPQCRAPGGAVTVTAEAEADPRVRGSTVVQVYPPTDTRGLGPPSAKALADACVARLRGGRDDER